MTGADPIGTLAGWIVIVMTVALVLLVWWMSRH
jgi:uncharacterized membrane-anchored protein